MADLEKPGDSGELSWGGGPQLPPPPAAGWNRIPEGYARAGAVPGSGTHQVPYGAGMGGAPPFPKPSTNLVGAILATFFCCLPTGIAAIVYAAQVDSRWNGGDWHGALESSRKARLWSNISLGLGLLVTVAYVALTAVGGGGSTTGY